MDAENNTFLYRNQVGWAEGSGSQHVPAMKVSVVSVDSFEFVKGFYSLFLTSFDIQYVVFTRLIILLDRRHRPCCILTFVRFLLRVSLTGRLGRIGNLVQ